MRIKWNELDFIFVKDLAEAVVLLLVGAFYDPIAAKLLIKHAAGFGVGQVLWCSWWALDIVVTYYYQYFYGE